MRKIHVILFALLLLSGCGAKDYSSTSSPVTYAVRDGTVFRISAFGEQTVATDADEVTTVRVGPDGRSLHFREKSGNVRCALMGSAAGDGPGTRPPSEPWTYPSIASYGSVSGCGFMGQAGGYLRSTAAFAFIAATPSGSEAELTIEQSGGTTLRFPITQEWADLLATASHNTTEYGGNSFVGGSLLRVLGNDGTFYSYPQLDAAFADGRIIIAFADLLIAIDTTHGRLMGTTRLSGPESEGMQNDSFMMRSNSHSPFGVLSSSWEGLGGIEAIIDVRGNTLVLHAMRGISQPSRRGYTLPIIEWSGSALLMHLYREIDVFDTLSASDRKLLQNPSDDVSGVDTQITQRLKEGGKYLDVVCSSAGMEEASCTALLPGAEVQLSPETDVPMTLEALRSPSS